MLISKLKPIILVSVFLLVMISTPILIAADENRITLSEGESANFCDGNSLVVNMADSDTQQVCLTLQRDGETIIICYLNKDESFEYPIHTHSLVTPDGKETYLGCMVSAKVESIESVNGVTSVTFDPFHVTDFELLEIPEVAPYIIIAMGESLYLSDDCSMLLKFDHPEKVTLELVKGSEVIDSSTLGRGEYFSYSTENFELSLRVDHINSIKNHKSVTFSPFNCERYKPVVTPMPVTPSATTATSAPSQTLTPASAISSTPTSVHQSKQTTDDAPLEDGMNESFDPTSDEKGDSLPGIGIFASLSVLLIAVQIFRRKK